jgi:alpha-1,3-rhamnosyltransferase
MDNNPLVSVVVCTYNSSKTIIETLESIKAQTYRDIEVVIGDDDSSDDSVILCENWVNSNKDRFYRCQIVTHSPNTGIPSNANRVYGAANGEWIKGIGADDKLLPNCISNFVEYVNCHPEACVIFSKVIGFGNMEAANKCPWLNVKRFFDTFDTKQFRIILSTQNFLPAASVFLKKKVWEDLGGYDESIPLMEDWPFWVKTLENGYKFDFLDKETVEYRFSESSISQGDKPLSKAYIDSNKKALLYAKYSLSSINILFLYFCKTMKVASRFRIFSSYIQFLLNLINPAYYEYRSVLFKFKQII